MSTKTRAATARISQEQFIERAILAHGNRYDYSEAVFIRSKQDVKIMCLSHGDFYQKAEKHMAGRGCKLCAFERTASKQRQTLAEFIDRAKAMHGDKFDYSFVQYRNSDTKVLIKCLKHGAFKVSPFNHLNGLGSCPKCKYEVTAKKNALYTLGFQDGDWVRRAAESENFKGFKIYVAKLTKGDETFYKIGKTFRTVRRRLTSQITAIYDVEILKVMQFEDGKQACETERHLHRLHKDYKYSPSVPFNGMHECFSEITNIELL